MCKLEYKRVSLEELDYKYLVSEDGRIYNARTGRELKQRTSFGPYPNVTLFIKGKSKLFNIHRLVAKAFIPNPDNKPQVNHIDCNKTNNHVSNLEWATPQENVDHMIANGKKFVHHGEKHANCTITDETVAAIREMCKTRPQLDAVREFGVSKAQVSRIVTGKRRQKETIK